MSNIMITVKLAKKTKMIFFFRILRYIFEDKNTQDERRKDEDNFKYNVLVSGALYIIYKLSDTA